MNIVAEVLKEHSKSMCDRIVRYVGNSPARFKELVKVFLKGPYRVTQRSGWPLSVCVEHHPALIKPYLKMLIGHLKKPGIHGSVKRNTVRLMQFIAIPKSLQGTVAETCFNFLNDSNEEIAVRCFAITVLANIAEDQPELGKELQIILEDMYPYPSAGMASRAKRTLKKISGGSHSLKS